MLDENCSSTALLKLPLLMETPETALDQNGCQGHPLIKCILRERERARMREQERLHEVTELLINNESHVGPELRNWSHFV